MLTENEAKYRGRHVQYAVDCLNSILLFPLQTIIFCEHEAKFTMITEVQNVTANGAHKVHPEAGTPHDVEADIVYFKPAIDGSFATIQDIASNDPRFCDVRRVLMRDIRGREKDFTLEEHGFEFVECQVEEGECESEDMIKKVHYPKMEEFVKDL